MKGYRNSVVLRGGELEDAAEFVSVSSAYYPVLGAYYAAEDEQRLEQQYKQLDDAEEYAKRTKKRL